jgi:hypothetical protein
LLQTSTTAIVCGAVVTYAIITWLRRQEQKMVMLPAQPMGEVGFAAFMKQRGDVPTA